MAVLKILREEAEPLGIHELLSRLPSDFAERSVRRWLSEFAKTGLIEKIGQKRATKYYSAAPTRFREQDEGCFSESSLKIITKIRRPVFERPPVPYMDVLRVRYRQQRRQLLSEIILQKKTGCSLLRM